MATTESEVNQNVQNWFKRLETLSEQEVEWYLNSLAKYCEDFKEEDLEERFGKVKKQMEKHPWVDQEIGGLVERVVARTLKAVQKNNQQEPMLTLFGLLLAFLAVLVAFVA